MESKRQRLLKSQIQQLSKTDACHSKAQKKEIKPPDPPANRERTRKAVNKGCTRTDVKGSTSDENRDVENQSQHNIQITNEEIDSLPEEKQTVITIEPSTPERDTDLVKEGDVTIKDFYHSFIQIEFELEENETNKANQKLFEDEILPDNTDEAEGTDSSEGYLKSKTMHHQLEKNFITDNQNITELEKNQDTQLSTQMINKKVQTKLNNQIHNDSETIDQEEKQNNILSAETI